MKKLILKFIILLFLIIAATYVIENFRVLGFNSFKPSLSIEVKGDKNILSWSGIPYPAYYKLEIVNRLPENDLQAMPANKIIREFNTMRTNLIVSNDYPLHTYWRISAHGLFRHPLGRYSDPICLADIMGISASGSKNLKPSPISYYPYSSPARIQPTLLWTKIPEAVSYEIEILSSLPENPNDILPSRYRLAASKNIYTNGYNADLSGLASNHLYWRVRAINHNDYPLGVYSDAAEIYIDNTLPPDVHPWTNPQTQMDLNVALLYPVYSWIPIQGAVNYEIELTASPPESTSSYSPAGQRIWSKIVDNTTNCYDEEPRIIPGIYYWRVRGLNENGQSVGRYSEYEQFNVDLTKGNYAATFGDSITHGGGAISYSPADWEYSFQSYLNFPVVNLGRSGDTSETMLTRFDKDVLPFKPKYLIILGGTNSLRGGTPAAQVISELAAIREKCLLNGIRPIFLTLPPINPAAIRSTFDEDTVPNWQEEFAAVNSFIRQERYVIDIEPYFSDDNGELPTHYAIDGLHPDIEGKKLMAQIINANWSRVTR